MNIIDFLIQHDCLVMLFTSMFLSGIFTYLVGESLDVFMGLSVVILVFLILITVACSFYFDDWDAARITKTIPAKELQLVELPNHTISVWYKTENLFTLYTVQDYLRKDKIDHIEYRHRDLFGLDYDAKKLIFKE